MLYTFLIIESTVMDEIDLESICQNLCCSPLPLDAS